MNAGTKKEDNTMEDKNQEVNAEELQQVAGGNGDDDVCPHCLRKGTLRIIPAPEGGYVYLCRSCQSFSSFSGMINNR